MSVMEPTFYSDGQEAQTGDHVRRIPAKHSRVACAACPGQVVTIGWSEGSRAGKVQVRWRGRFDDTGLLMRKGRGAWDTWIEASALELVSRFDETITIEEKQQNITERRFDRR